MAGPGGGPPRRSHTKSRKGCDACKRRHIRCDENFPQCRNCTKHKVRCPYNDVPSPDDRASPEGPDLMWTPEIRATIDQWRHTGLFPFPSLGIYPAPAPQFLSVEKLRLIHHVASISHQMVEIGATGFTLWTRQIPTLIKIAATHDYVLHALLAFSAMHIAFRTDCPLVGNMAYEHRGIALKGLHEAIGDFSKDTSDAILAASLLLSWQTTDWRSWTQLMQGTSSVIDAMEQWKHESQFGDFIAESSTFPTAPPSPTPDHKPMQPSKEDLDAFQRALQQLRKVETHLKRNREDPKSIAQLANFLKGARKVSPTLSISQQFERLRPLRTWLFWLPVLFLQETQGSPSALITIAHYYAVALLMERLFPDIGAAYFGSLTIGPVEEIARRLFSANSTGSLDGDLQAPLALMEYPIDTVNEFRSRMGWVQPSRTLLFPQYNPPNFYIDGGDVARGSPMPLSAAATAASSSEYLPYGQNPTFNYSTGNLSVVTTDSAPNSAVSPQQLPSPFGNAAQYLSIPSPSYSGVSPTTSTLGDFGDASSVAFSDNDDFGSFDACGFAGGGAPMFRGASNNYGAGTPHLLNTTPSRPLAASPYLHPGQQLSVPFFSPLGPPQPRHASLSFQPGHRHNISTASAPPSFYQNGI